VLHSDNNPREEYGSIAVSLLIVLHNGFYAFAFEFVVVTTCKLALYIIFSVTVHFLHNLFTYTGILINFKPVDIWTSVYIVHLLVCLLSEDVQNDETSPQRRSSRYNHIMRLVSFGIIAIVLVARYVLALSLQRGFFF